MKKVLASTMSVAALMLAWGPLGAGSAQALPDGTNGCAPSTVRKVVQTGIYYSSIGSAAGKYNPSTVTSTLSYSLSKTTQRSTALQVGASMTLTWAVAQVEANTSYTVTNTTTTGSTVTDTLSVPSHYYGYDQPKVEYRTYHIYDRETNPDCTYSTGNDYGYVNAITAYPFFSACVATSACTPKP